MKEYGNGYRQAVKDIANSAKSFQKIYERQADELTKILLSVGSSMSESAREEYVKHIADLMGAAKGMERFGKILEDTYKHGEECML